MTRQDVLLSILAAAEGDPLTPAQLQKVTFLVSEEFKGALPDDFYEFEAFHYGPFCVEVYRDAQELERQGLATIAINLHGGWRDYSATARGYKRRCHDLSHELASYIDNKVTWARSLSFQELIRAIYTAYPQYAVNSVFRN